jgi:hypothetical protein
VLKSIPAIANLKSRAHEPYLNESIPYTMAAFQVNAIKASKLAEPIACYLTFVFIYEFYEQQCVVGHFSLLQQFDWVWIDISRDIDVLALGRHFYSVLLPSASF